MPASWCPKCQEITMVKYTEMAENKKITVIVTCRKCWSTISKTVQ